MKPLDFVKSAKGGIGMITETNDKGTTASVDWIYNPHHEHNAWWSAEELIVIHSLPRLLALATKHPFGTGEADAKRAFPLEKKVKELR